MLVLTTVKIIKYLFTMNDNSIKASQSYAKFYKFDLRSFVNFDPETDLLHKHNVGNSGHSSLMSKKKRFREVDKLFC